MNINQRIIPATAGLVFALTFFAAADARGAAASITNDGVSRLWTAASDGEGNDADDSFPVTALPHTTYANAPHGIAVGGAFPHDYARSTNYYDMTPTSLRITGGQVFNGRTPAFAQAHGSIAFTVNQPTSYALGGNYAGFFDDDSPERTIGSAFGAPAAADFDGFVEFHVRLEEVASGLDLFNSDQASRYTGFNSDSQFNMHSLSSRVGNVMNDYWGTPTGTLQPGKAYALTYNMIIQSYDQDDYMYGQANGQISLAFSAVTPEPALLGALGLGACGLLRGRRSR